ncbi:class I SAM-dependent methyltransferase [Rhodocytophaga rosea]|nr:class I SAM-dependent methyltransferase [Rhodocytophaga rosea]
MLEKIEKCPVCNSENYYMDIICKDYVISQEEFQIVKCQSCNFRFTNPRPGQQEIGKYYQSTDYISHQDDNEGVINKLYYIVKQKNLNSKLQLINDLYNKGSVLDIGCGTGSFLEICKKDGWITVGIEPDEKARKKAVQKTQGEVKENIYELPFQKFDIITMWHVLEHVHLLNETIEKIKQLLNENGKLIIAVPNRDSYDAKRFGTYWAAYDVPRHLYHFTQETLMQLMKKHQLKIFKVLPMKYDAYYISLMSLKHKYNQTRFVSAITTGLLSNKWAKKNNNNYSSLTYIFSK